jgi:predicted glycosyltransferase
LQTTRLKIWIDIENPPQVQYLVPFADAFRQRGAEVVVTARDYGNALALLTQRAASFTVVGGEFGRSKAAKAAGALMRARKLASLLAHDRKPHALICASRSAAIAARYMRVPSFVIGDYEYSNSSVYRLTRSTILYPDVIDPAPLLAGGIRREQLVAFRGIKEDISLGNVDTAATAPHRFPEIEGDALVRVLFRPPSERSHYYNPASRSLALRTFEYLAQQPNVIVIISPRHAWQAEELVRIPSRHQPIVLDRPIPFVALLKAVDVVVCSGGTMLREAAYLGVPAYSIFKSPIGGVDRYLASIGRVHLIQSPEALPTIQLRKASPAALLRSNPHLLDELIQVVLDRTARAAQR